MREAEHNASESNRVTDNEMYQLTTFRMNNSASLTFVENLNFIILLISFFHYSCMSLSRISPQLYSMKPGEIKGKQ